MNTETSPTDHARNLADIAADKLVRLAEDLEAIAGIKLDAAPGLERERAEAGVAESRREAAGALERVQFATRGVEPTRAQVQAAALRAGDVMTGEDARAWAAAWRAFADAA